MENAGSHLRNAFKYLTGNYISPQGSYSKPNLTLPCWMTWEQCGQNCHVSKGEETSSVVSVTNAQNCSPDHSRGLWISLDFRPKTGYTPSECARAVPVGGRRGAPWRGHHQTDTPMCWLMERTNNRHGGVPFWEASFAGSNHWSQTWLWLCEPSCPNTRMETMDATAAESLGVPQRTDRGTQRFQIHIFPGPIKSESQRQASEWYLLSVSPTRLGTTDRSHPIIFESQEIKGWKCK